MIIMFDANYVICIEITSIQFETRKNFWTFSKMSEERIFEHFPEYSLNMIYVVLKKPIIMVLKQHDYSWSRTNLPPPSPWEAQHVEEVGGTPEGTREDGFTGVQRNINRKEIWIQYKLTGSNLDWLLMCQYKLWNIWIDRKVISRLTKCHYKKNQISLETQIPY